jgi:hypothetical protein
MHLTKRIALLGAVVGLVGLQAPALAEEGAKAEKKGKFIGVANCGKCHKSKTKGNQLGQWKESRHAGAYATLGMEEAKKIAAGMKIADPQKADACLKCHITAHGVDAAGIEPIPEGKKGHSIEDGVGCESCHGAGSEYKARKVMKKRDDAIAAGLVMPTKELCVKCHNEESPTYKEFKFEEMVEKVKHPNPKKAGAAK